MGDPFIYHTFLGPQHSCLLCSPNLTGYMGPFLLKKVLSTSHDKFNRMDEHLSTLLIIDYRELYHVGCKLCYHANGTNGTACFKESPGFQ